MGVIPAEAGTQLSTSTDAESGAPAFAGVTLPVGMGVGSIIRPKSLQEPGTLSIVGVIPAEAGTQLSTSTDAESGAPAFAGVTLPVGMGVGSIIRPKSLQEPGKIVIVGVIPAEAGTQLSTSADAESGAPAFAGVTLPVGIGVGQITPPSRFRSLAHLLLRASSRRRPGPSFPRVPMPKAGPRPSPG